MNGGEKFLTETPLYRRSLPTEKLQADLMTGEDVVIATIENDPVVLFMILLISDWLLLKELGAFMKEFPPFPIGVAELLLITASPRSIQFFMMLFLLPI